MSCYTRKRVRPLSFFSLVVFPLHCILFSAECQVLLFPTLVAFSLNCHLFLAGLTTEGDEIDQLIRLLLLIESRLTVL